MSAEVSLPGVPLRAEAVTAGYGGDPVIRDISVGVDPGEVISLVGPNGSGKSTLLKGLVGVVRVSSGTVSVGGRQITNLPPEEVARAGVGYVPQVDDIFAPLTVKENLEMGGYLLRRGQLAPRIERVLAIFPALSGMLGRSAGKLSGGERKMLAMGRVLMLDPGVFLLDEPTANLAPMIAGSLLEEHVRGLAHRGAAGQGRAGHLEPHVRARRRRGPDGGHPGGAVGQPRVRRVLPRWGLPAVRPLGRGLRQTGAGPAPRGYSGSILAVTCRPASPAVTNRA